MEHSTGTQGADRPARMWQRGWWTSASRRHVYIVLVGAGLNFTFVSIGFNGAFGASWPLAFAIALIAISIQTVLYEELLNNGLLGFVFGIGFCLAAISGNVVLAAGGITAAFGADNLGRASFTQAVGEQRRAIQAFVSSINAFAQAADGVARHSSEQYLVEGRQGGTCDASPPGSNGPFSRLRQQDAEQTKQVNADLMAVVAEANALDSAIDTAIANYRASQHAKSVKVIGDATIRAGMLAGDARVAAARQFFETRAAQVRNGRPDSKNPVHLVFCPRDQALAGYLKAALDQPLPVAPPRFEAPPVPTDATSVQGLFSALAAKAQWKEADLGPWLASLWIAPAPDGLFLYGLYLHRRRRNRERTLRGRQAERLGIDGDFDATMQRVRDDTRLKDLHASHIREHYWFVVSSDWLAIPASDWQRCHWASGLVDIGEAFDAGFRLGRELPKGAQGFDAATTYRVFALRKEVWSKLEIETIRSIIGNLNPESPPPEQPTSNRPEPDQAKDAA